jgi:copper chaperone CopZ
METLSLRVMGMTCGGCENAVKRGLARLEGVSVVAASHTDGKVTVTYDPAAVKPDEIKSKIASIGYTVAE